MKQIPASIIGRRGTHRGVKTKYDLEKGDVVVFGNGNIGVVGEYLDYVYGPEQFIHFVVDDNYNSRTLIGSRSTYEDDMTSPGDAHRSMDIVEVYRDISGKIAKELVLADNTIKMIKFINELNSSKRYKKLMRVY